MAYFLDAKATILLPIACEYQVEKLKNDCIKELMKMAYPRLELVTLAHRFDLEELPNKATGACVSRVHSGTLAKQPSEPENSGLPERLFSQILL